MDRTKIQKEFVSGVDQSVFRWFGHVNRIAESVWLNVVDIGSNG